MNRWIKLISWILCFSMILQVPCAVYGSEPEETTEYLIPVLSNASSMKQAVLLEQNGKYFFSAEDIGAFTRSVVMIAEDSTTLEHGVRRIVIDQATGIATDTIEHLAQYCLFEQELPVQVIEYKDSYYFEAIPMLMYMGATCAIIEDGALSIWMPTYTIYESIYTSYWYDKIDITKKYGSQENVNDVLTLALCSDFLDFIDGEGVLSGFDVHIENAMYEILNVEVAKYASVQSAAASELKLINDFITSMGTEKSSVMVYFEDFILDCVVESDITRGEILYRVNYNVGDIEEASRISKELNEKIYNQQKRKGDLDQFSKDVDSFMLAFDIAATSHALMQYDESTRNLFSDALNDRVLSMAQYNVKNKKITDEIAKNLSSTSNIVSSTAIDKVVDYFKDAITEKGIEQMIKSLTSSAGLATALIEIGGTLISALNYDQNQAFSADLNAILLGIYQSDIAACMANYFRYGCNDGRNLNEVTLEDYKNLLILYCRATIAFNENYGTAIKMFDKKNGESRAQACEMIADSYAEYLYRLTNCAVVPPVGSEDLEQDLIQPEWLEKVAAETGHKDLTRYREILDIYCTSISCGWSNMDGANSNAAGDPDNVCELFPRFLREYSLDEIGYGLADVDRNGICELFIAPLDLNNTSEFYDMYTISNGEIVHTVAAGERDHYYLAEDCTIKHYGSSGASVHVDANYRLSSTDGKLKISQAVIYDEWLDEDDPYFLSASEYCDPDTYDYIHDALKPISEEEATAILASFPENAAIEWTSLWEYRKSVGEDVEDSPLQISKHALVGEWSVDTEYTQRYHGKGMTWMFGRPYYDGMEFDESGNFFACITYYGGSGQYEIVDNHILYNMIDDCGEEISGEIEYKKINGTVYLIMDIIGFTTFWVKGN